MAVELTEDNLRDVRDLISKEFPIGDEYRGIKVDNIKGITFVKTEGPGNLVTLGYTLEDPHATDNDKEASRKFHARIRPILIIVMYLKNGSIIEFTGDFDDELKKRAILEDHSVGDFKSYSCHKIEVTKGHKFLAWNDLFNSNSIEMQSLFGRIICQIVGKFADSGTIEMWKHRAGGSRKPKTRTNRKKRQPSNRKKRQSRKRQARK